MTAVATTQQILDALKPNQALAQWQSDLVARQIDWDDLVVRAIVLGLAPQLHHRLACWSLQPPPRAAAKLAVTYQAQAKRNAAITAQLDELLDACVAENLRPIALKGIHLAACYYANPALRPMNDIDLLFAPAELPRAEALLTRLGYGGKHKSADMGAGVTKHTSTFRRAGAQTATINPYLSAAGERMVEPHISLEESWFGLKVDITPGTRERAETVMLGERPCRVLTPDDLLLHLCLHFCFHLIEGAPAFVQLTDLLIVSASGRVDWPIFTNRACHYRAAPYALAALSLAQKLLAAPVPEETLAELAQATPVRLRRRIAGRGLPDILRRTQQKPLINIRQRLVRGVQDRAETARWARDGRDLLRIWATLLQAARTDTGQMILSRLKRET